MRSRLFVADLDHLDVVAHRQRLIDRQVVHADDPKHVAHAQARQRRCDGFAASHLTHRRHTSLASLIARTVALRYREPPSKPC